MILIHTNSLFYLKYKTAEKKEVRIFAARRIADGFLFKNEKNCICICEFVCYNELKHFYSDKLCLS